MIFDKLSCFSNNQSVPATAGTTTVSTKCVDLRKCNLIDGELKLYAQIVGDAPTTGAVTTILQTSDDLDAETWTDVVSFTQDGNVLAAAILPIKGKKRFLRLAFVTGSEALSAAITVKAGLVDEFDRTDIPALQAFPPAEDLTTQTV